MRRKPTAWITLRHQPPYRCNSFVSGLTKLGFNCNLAFPIENQVQPGDVVVTWNLNPRYRQVAEFAKTNEAQLIVAENGYITKRGSSEPFYALARDGHNGSGRWFVGSQDRWALLNHSIQPWKDSQGYVLIAEQRGIGSEIMKSPYSFSDSIEQKVRRVLRKNGLKSVGIKRRGHPGRHVSKTTLREDLDGARAVVSWSSNVLNIALLYGIPAFRAAPYHVNSAAIDDINLLPDPPRLDREVGFKKLAWAQWGLSEIESGVSFKHLLQDVI